MYRVTTRNVGVTANLLSSVTWIECYRNVVTLRPMVWASQESDNLTSQGLSVYRKIFRCLRVTERKTRCVTCKILQRRYSVASHGVRYSGVTLLRLLVWVWQRSHGVTSRITGVGGSDVTRFSFKCERLNCVTPFLTVTRTAFVNTKSGVTEMFWSICWTLSSRSQMLICWPVLSDSARDL